jgi:hypothetical protein
MNTNITSADVSAWLKEQLSELHDTHEYAAITVGISQYREGTNPPWARFSVYTGSGQPASHEKASIEECIADMATQTPKSRADQLREKAAKLMAEAEEIEVQTETKP